MAIRIGRRQFISALGGATAAWPLAVRAQQPSGMRRLGVLMSNLANDPEGRARAAALMQGLGTLNWKDGGDLRIDWRWAGGDFALFEQYAAELVALGPDVLLAGSSSVAVEALRRHTSTIPIVFTGISDPIGQGFVANLARPGGTVTGLSSFDPPIAGKWLEMLTQITPPVARVAVLFNPATAPYAGLYVRAIEEAAPSFAVTMRAAPCHDDAEIEAMIAGLAREGRGGLIALPDPFILVHREAIVGIAGRHSVPAVYPFRFLATMGGLMSYGVDQYDIYRRAASYVDRILKGEKPGDLPVQAPTKFELVINLKTAKALDITIATSLLATADEVIE
jgi:putative tryptophan/tyrosine transport system substrate-binding protein